MCSIIEFVVLLTYIYKVGDITFTMAYSGAPLCAGRSGPARDPLQITVGRDRLLNLEIMLINPARLECVRIKNLE